jgi:hypothetical protein
MERWAKGRAGWAREEDDVERALYTAPTRRSSSRASCDHPPLALPLPPPLPPLASCARPPASGAAPPRRPACPTNHHHQPCPASVLHERHLCAWWCGARWRGRGGTFKEGQIVRERGWGVRKRGACGRKLRVLVAQKRFGLVTLQFPPPQHPYSAPAKRPMVLPPRQHRAVVRTCANSVSHSLEYCAYACIARI